MLFIFRFSKAIISPEYKDIDPILANQLFEFYHKYENSIEASDTWYDASCKGYCDYWDCDGDRLLNWKDKGYKTIFDLLMVLSYIYSIYSYMYFLYIII